VTLIDPDCPPSKTARTDQVGDCCVSKEGRFIGA
jgi:hypothetical protein